MDTKPEIYRHLRPRWFHSLKHELQPHACGGISFALRATDRQRVYDFWIYICPPTIPFSSKQSVKQLRKSIEQNVKPWSTIELTDEPIIDQLVRSLIKEQHELPSEVAKQALDIVINNYQSERKKSLAEARRRGAVTAAYTE